MITEVDTIRNYQNRFGPDTRPASTNQAGGHSFFEAYEFSENLPVASFRFRKTNTSDYPLQGEVSGLQERGSYPRSARPVGFPNQQQSVSSAIGQLHMWAEGQRI
ncbi:hypothetical protein RZS08_23400, partial [Arthrospira platensis SPKY1]|nr:hypothetical protein [Arthrospira platensis SPKY1]